MKSARTSSAACMRGLVEEARALKKTRHILMSSRSTLQAKDAQARTGEPISRSGSIFPKEEYVRKEGYEARYDELLSQNKLLFTLDLIKERLSLSYTRTDEARMADDITWIMIPAVHPGTVIFSGSEYSLETTLRAS